MNKREMLALICLGLVVGLLIPTDIFASEVSDVYGAKDILKVGGKLKTFMFDVAVPYVGGIFGGIRAVKSLASNEYESLGKWALLAASSFIIPPYINNVWGSAMLIF